MKKVYLLVSGLLLTAGAANAQVSTQKAYLPIQKNDASARMMGLAAHRAPGDVIVEDDFSDPANWNTEALTGEPNWEITATTPADVADYADEVMSETADNGFGVFNGITMLLTGTVEPSDAVLEYVPTIDLSDVGLATLQFYNMYRAFNSDQVFVELSDDGGMSWPHVYELHTDMPTNDPTRHEVMSISLNDVTGSSEVKVRFRWTELGGDPSFGSGYAWAIDDMQVIEAWDYDQEILASYHRSGIGVYSAYGMEYHFIPENQLTDITFIGQTQNLGGATQPNAKLNVEVAGAGSYSGVSDAFDLPVGGADSVATNTTFTPSALGEHTVSFWFDCDEAEEETNNDTVSGPEKSIFVTGEAEGYIYSRDNGFGGSSIGNVTSNEGAPLLIGNVMDIFGDDMIGAVDVVVTSDATNVGQLIFAQVMVLDPGSGTFVYLDQTPDHEITSGENGGPIRLIFDEHIDVSAGQTILVLAGHYGGSDEVRFRMAQGVEEQTVLGYTSGASDPFYLTSPSAVMVRTSMMQYNFDNIVEEAAQNFSVGQNQPNPFGDNAVINYELNEAANVMIEFTDLSGKVVKTINNGQQQAGAHTLYIDANDFAEGVYFYTFTVGAEKITKRMVISK
ncbi:MAG: T9SS type A sorting domain-containing protein [Crocinitomicaceae bacterium]